MATENSWTGSSAGQTIMQLWEQSDQDSERKLKKVLLEGLDTALREDSQFCKMIKKGPQVSNPIVRWMEERDYPDTIKATLSSTTMTVDETHYLFGAAPNTVNIKKVIREGTILERRSDGVQAIVDDTAFAGLAASPYTFSVAAYGNTSLSNNATSEEWDIISEVWYDRRDADASRSLDRTFRKCGTQTFAESFEILHMRENTKYELVSNEKEHQLAALMRKLERQLHLAIIRSRPKYSGGYIYGDEDEAPTLRGLHSIPEIEDGTEDLGTSYVNLSSTAVTKDDIDDLVYNMYLNHHSNFNSGNWVIACHPLVHKYINDFDISYRRKTADDKSVGFHVDVFDSKIGKTFPIKSDQYFRPDVLHVVNMDSLSYGYYAGDTPWRKEIATAGRYKQWMVTFTAYGLVHRKPRQNIGTIYGISTS